MKFFTNDLSIEKNYFEAGGEGGVGGGRGGGGASVSEFF